MQGAKIYVDGSEIDYTSPVEITYGKHTLKVTADGYDTWTRTLYVNSKEATIQITINDDTDSSANDSSGTKTKQHWQFTSHRTDTFRDSLREG